MPAIQTEPHAFPKGALAIKAYRLACCFFSYSDDKET